MVAAAGNSALAMFDGSTGDLSKLASQRGPMGVGSARIESEDSGRIRRMYARSQRGLLCVLRLGWARECGAWALVRVQCLPGCT